MARPRSRVCSHLGRPKTARTPRSPDRAGARSACARSSRTSGSRCWRTPASIPARRRTTPRSPRELAQGCDLYVNDAFGSAHRAHASTDGVAQLCRPTLACSCSPSSSTSARLLGDVERPFLLVTGGAKVEDKLGVLKNLGGRADAVLVGGKMAEELRDENPLPFPVVLPTDVVAAGAFEADAETRVTPFDALPDGWLGLDIGPDSRGDFARRIARREDGVLERPHGCLRVGAVRGGDEGGRAGGRAQWTRYTVVGGGDSVRARQRARPRRHGSRGFRPAAARRWSCSRARSSRASPRSRGIDPMLIAGQLEDVQGPGRGACLLRRLRGADGVDVVFCPPYVSLGAAVETGQTIYRPERPLGGERPLHRRGLAGDAPRARGQRRARRPLGAAAALRRERRDGRAARAKCALERGSA